MPGDALSLQNAAGILVAQAVPLVVDPASRADTWLEAKLREGGTAVEVTNPRAPGFMTALELAVR